MGLSESKSLLLGQTSSSCSSKGALLLVAAANGDLQVAQEILRSNPKAALFYNFKDRSSPLIQAAARGHFELVQLLLETAVMSEGPERAKRHCIDHANIKRQTALMVACKHGHPDCVEYLVTNGADPLLTDERRHNTCLHFAALYGHSECVHKLLSCRAGAGFRGQGDVQVPVARIPCINDVDGSQVQFVDGHNGWGLTALHIAVFQGSVNTVKVLLRHGASLEVVIAPPRVENSPIRCAAGSNALHIAALIGNISMAKLMLEAQEAFPGLELRAHVDSLGMRPQEYAQRARSPVLLHLLDERLPVHLLRQIWLNYSLDSGLPARHHTLASMLQKLKLMFNLEVIAIQRQLTLMDASCSKHAAQQQQQQQQQQEAVAPGSCDQAADEEGHPSCDSQVEVDRALQELLDEEHRAGGARAGAAAASAAGRASNPGLSQQQQQHQQQEDNHHQQQHLQQQQQQQLQQLQDQLQQQQTAEAAAAVAAARQQWVSQMASIESLLATIARLHSSLQGMCSREAAAAAAAAAHGVGWPPSPSPAHEAILDFILSTLITPRTVSAVLHAAKKLVSASMMHVSSSTGVLNAAGAAGACALEGPPSDTETQHSMALLTTALRAVETCLHASSQLTAPALVEKADRAAAAAVAGGAVPPATGAAASAAAAAAVGLPPRIGSGSAVSTAAASGTMPALVQQAATGTGGVREQPNQQERAAPGAVDGSSRTGHSDAHSACAAFPTPPTQQQGMGTGAGGTADGMQHDAMSPPSSHWSSHLHTLIAQLQWDIGVQRHRRRRAHAAASAARTAAIPQAGGAVPTDSPEAVAALAAAHGRILPPSHPSTLHFLAPPAPTTLGHPPPSLVMLHHPSASPTAAAGDLGGTVEPHQEGADERGVLAEGTEGVRATDSGSHEGRRALSLEHRSPPPQHTPGSSGAAPQATHRALLHPSLQRSPSAAAAAAAAGELSSRQGRAQGVQPLEGVLGAEANSCGQACSGTTAPALPHTHARSLEVSPLATELAAQLSQESASAQDSRFTGAAASAAACMPQLKSSGSNPGQHGSRGAADCQRHTGSSLALQQALHEHDITEAAAHEAGLATASECEDDEDDGSSIGSEDDEERGMCPICMDTPISVVVSSCQHGLCVQCAFQLTVKGRELPSCPFCRQKIGGFDWTVSPLESPSASKRKTPTPKQSKA